MTSALVNGLTNPENFGTNGTVSHALNQPYMEIVEQPASKALRFRYECEGRSAGSIPGAHNTSEQKTYPTVRIVGYKGRAVIVVSCVTKDEPYRAHPHNLVGKENCKDGICTMEVNNDSMTATFSNLGIQCVKKKDIEEALKIREKKRVDPFGHGFDHSSNASSIDLNAVRLCFQAFLSGSEPKKFHVLTPVVSDVIYDKKAMSDLVIIKLSHASAPATSPQEMILLCEKVAKEDIQVRFFELINEEVVWEGTGDFTPTQVHKQVAIVFKTPKYNRTSVDEGAVKVFIQLRRPSDGATSEPLPFLFTPDDSGPKPKRRKYPEGSHMSYITQPLNQLQQQQHQQQQQQQQPQTDINNIGAIMGAGAVYLSPSHQQFNPIKIEPNASPDYRHYTQPPIYEHPVPSPSSFRYPNPLPHYEEIRKPENEQPNPSPGYQSILHELLPPVTPGFNSDVQVGTVSSSEFSLGRLDSGDLLHVDEITLSENMNNSLNIGSNEESNMNDSLTNLANRTFDREYRQQ